MGQAAYRQSIDAFIEAANWTLQYPEERANMEQALHWFNRSVPGHVLDAPAEDRRTRRAITASANRGGSIAWRPKDRRFTKLMSWMQAMRFSEKVVPDYYVPRSRRLLTYKPGDMIDPKRPGNFFVLLPKDEKPGANANGPKGLGIPSMQRVPHVFVAVTDFTCLRTVAGDAFISWMATSERYASGGRHQLFIWDAARYLSPIA